MLNVNSVVFFVYAFFYVSIKNLILFGHISNIYTLHIFGLRYHFLSLNTMFKGFKTT